MRIDELAAATGVTSRNIRAYREKGLLPAPELEGRTGFYTEEHRQRLDIIEDLQARGFSLEAIRQILDAWSVGGDISHLLGLQSILNSPFHSEEPAYETIPQLLSRFPDAAADPQLLTRAISLGLLEPHDGDTVRLPSPMLIEAGTELTDAGVPLAEVLDLFEQIQADMADVADQFIGIVERNLVDAAVTLRGDATPADVLDKLQRLRPLATEVIRPVLSRQLTVAIDRAMRRVASRLGAADDVDRAG